MAKQALGQSPDESSPLPVFHCNWLNFAASTDLQQWEQTVTCSSLSPPPARAASVRLPSPPPAEGLLGNQSTVLFERLWSRGTWLGYFPLAERQEERTRDKEWAPGVICS